jgi:hypothetical protein
MIGGVVEIERAEEGAQTAICSTREEFRPRRQILRKNRETVRNDV